MADMSEKLAEISRRFIIGTLVLAATHTMINAMDYHTTRETIIKVDKKYGFTREKRMQINTEKLADFENNSIDKVLKWGSYWAYKTSQENLISKIKKGELGNDSAFR